jgi:hypothetical protein
LSDILQAFEFIDTESMEITLNEFKKEPFFEKKHNFYAIVEVASNNDPEVVPEDSERLLEFIETVGDNLQDGIVP